MSDADDPRDLGRDVLTGSGADRLRARMREFVESRSSTDDLKTVRRRLSDGTSLSAAVDTDRDERF